MDSSTHPAKDGPLRSNIRRNRFSQAQTDPVEAKCAEINQFLHSTGLFVNDSDLVSHITRDNLSVSHDLYGALFHRHFPFVHGPSYQIIETPSILCVVMMVVGACYRPSMIPSNHLSRFAIQLSLLFDDGLVSSALCQSNGAC